MKLCIATNSVDKLNGVRFAFSRFFQIEETEIEILHRSVNSGVPDQPFDEEIYLGAVNRVNDLISSEGNGFDFYISCEAGIEEFMGNFFNVQVVCIFDKETQAYIFGKSTGWQLPSKDIEIIRDINLDNYLRSYKGITDIKDLLGDNNSRANSVSQATEMALHSMKLR